MTAQGQPAAARQRGGSTLEYVAVLSLLTLAILIGGAGLNIGFSIKSVFQKLTGTFTSVDQQSQSRQH